MGGFAVGQATGSDFADPATYRPDPSPISFGGALQATWDEARQVTNDHVRQAQLNDMMWERQRQVEQITGQRLTPSEDMMQGDTEIAPDMSLAPDVQIFDQATYEAKLDQMKAADPRLAKVPTLDQLRQTLAARLGPISATAQQARAYHPVAAFLGSAAGGLTDPLNLSLMALTAPVAPEGVLARMGVMGASNALTEVAQVPDRFRDAQVAGPAYTGGQAALDVAAAGVGGAALEGGGHALGTLVGALVRRLPGLDRFAAAPEARAAMNVAEQAGRDVQAVGPQASPDFEQGLDALAEGKPPPVIEPASELGDLFDGPPSSALRDLPTRGGLSDQPGLTGMAEYRGRPIYQGSFDPADLQTDPGRFQYKADGDAQGVTARLKGVDAWDPTSSGKVIVYQDADGQSFIADGHQRLALASRMQGQGFDALLDGYVFREADGWTPRQVRTIAALKNIREGSGTILDAAKVFRDAPQAITDPSLPMTGDFITQARSLSKLEPEAFGAVVNKVIPERYGAEIGAMAGDRPDLQPGLVRLMKQADPANLDEARALISEAKQDDWLQSQGETADMFGGVAPESTVIARAKVKAAVLNAVRKDVKVYGQLVKHADAIEAGGNTLLRDANEAQAAVSRTALEVISRLSLRAGDVGEAMASAAREVMEGKRPADAAKGLVQMVKGRISRGEALDGLRAAAIDPPGPGEASGKLLDRVDDPKAWAETARPAAEDAKIETPEAGLFPDLDLPGGEERAHQRLKACAPGE